MAEAEPAGTGRQATARKSTSPRRSVALTPAAVTSCSPPVKGAGAAAEKAVDSNGTGVRLPVVGTVYLPPVDHLAWYGGVAALTALELLEWPVALVLAVGKVLSDNRTHRTVRALGDALEEAG